MIFRGAVIFDMDGLMVDTEALAIETWQDAARAEQCEMTRELCIALIGLNDRDSEQLLARSLGPDFPLARVSARYQREFRQRLHAGCIRAKPGLYDLLNYLDSREIPKAVATSSSRATAILKLSTVRVLDRFPHIITSEQVARGKPAPDIFLLAADKLGVPPARCTVLEDSEPGIRAAHAAGMRAIMVPDIKPPSPDIIQLAAQVLPNLCDVRGFLARDEAR